MAVSKFFFGVRYLTLLVTISIIIFNTSIFSQLQQPTGWPKLYNAIPNEIPNVSLNNYTINRFSKNVSTNKDTSTFSEIPIEFPGVIAGDAIWFDYDNDGDLDIIISGLADIGKCVTKIYRNEDGRFIDTEAPIAQVISEKGIAWGDFDNDGDFDLAIQGRLDTTAMNNVTKIYCNDDGHFIDIKAPLLGLNGGSLIWADIDNDGLLDLLSSGSTDNGYSFFTKIYKNTKEGFVDINANLPGVWGSSIAFGDYDNDSDLDLLLTGYGHLGTISKLYRNDIINNQITFVDTYIHLQPVNSSAVAWGDYDNDGYLDIALTGVSYGYPVTKIYRNNNGISFTDINASLKPMTVSALAWGDYDNDGDLDLAVSGAEDWYYAKNPATIIYRNDNGTFFDINVDITGTWFGSLAWGDYDNDGKLDLLVSGGTVERPFIPYQGPFYPITKIYKNNTNSENTPPDVPQNLSVVVVQGKRNLRWDASTDNQTPKKSLTYNLRIGKTPGGHEIVSPVSNTYTGYRRVPKFGNQSFKNSWTIKNLPPGTYYWSVQTVDNGYASSSFATEKSFTISPNGIIEEHFPTEYVLYQNYPNPFNPTTTIKYQLSEDVYVKLVVYDLLGREIETLVNEVKKSGSYEVEFKSKNLSSGIYYYKMNAGNYFSTKKMILAR